MSAALESIAKVPSRINCPRSGQVLRRLAWKMIWIIWRMDAQYGVGLLQLLFQHKSHRVHNEADVWWNIVSSEQQPYCSQKTYQIKHEIHLDVTTWYLFAAGYAIISSQSHVISLLPDAFAFSLPHTFFFSSLWFASHFYLAASDYGIHRTELHVTFVCKRWVLILPWSQQQNIGQMNCSGNGYAKDRTMEMLFLRFCFCERLKIKNFLVGTVNLTNTYLANVIDR